MAADVQLRLLGPAKVKSAIARTQFYLTILLDRSGAHPGPTMTYWIARALHQATAGGVREREGNLLSNCSEPLLSNCSEPMGTIVSQSCTTKWRSRITSWFARTGELSDAATSSRSESRSSGKETFDDDPHVLLLGGDERARLLTARKSPQKFRPGEATACAELDPAGAPRDSSSPARAAQDETTADSPNSDFATASYASQHGQTTSPAVLQSSTTATRRSEPGEPGGAGAARTYIGPEARTAARGRCAVSGGQTHRLARVRYPAGVPNNHHQRGMGGRATTASYKGSAANESPRDRAPTHQRLPQMILP